MTDYIIIAALLVVLFFAARSGMKHFRGEGECCGGGSSYKAKARKIGKAAAKRTIIVEGMTCQHCVNRVMEAVNSIDGVSAVVNLKKGTVHVSMEKIVADEVLKNAIEKAGYVVKEMNEYDDQ